MVEVPGSHEEHVSLLRRMIDETEDFSDAVVDAGYELGIDMDNDELRHEFDAYFERLARKHGLEIRGREGGA